MKITTVAAILTGCFLVSNAIAPRSASAQSADDKKWIAQCQADNKNEGAKEDVVLKYCTCMNDKMDNNENRSITQWEKSHATERKACEQVSGWK
jgi:hypothetical protein